MFRLWDLLGRFLGLNHAGNKIGKCGLFFRFLCLWGLILCIQSSKLYVAQSFRVNLPQAEPHRPEMRTERNHFEFDGISRIHTNSVGWLKVRDLKEK